MKKAAVRDIICELEKASSGSFCCFTLEKWDDNGRLLLPDEKLADICREKSLRVFIQIDDPVQELPESWRLFTLYPLASLPKYTILEAGKVKYHPVVLPWPCVIKAGGVAGYHTLAFEEPPESIPLVYVHPEYPHLFLALFPLTSFADSRFAPYCKWGKLYQNFTGLTPPANVTGTRWSKDDILPESAEEECRLSAYEALCRTFLYRENGILKVAEGFSGEIAADGSQTFRKLERSDCVLEVAAALAASGIAGNPEHRTMADEIIRRLMLDPEHTVLDPRDPCTALMNFYVKSPIYYISGNSQGAVLLAACQHDPQFCRQILRMMFALYRLTGTAGNARNSFTVPDSFCKNQWDFYGREDYRYPCPHRQAALWSMLLAAWKVTRHQPFLALAKKGIYGFMEIYPDIPWTNDYSAELAKMLRPLAFLYRLEPVETHRNFLKKIVDDIEKLMLPCGAVRASLFNLEKGLYPPPRSNDEYGKREASLIQTEKDICCDLLYAQAFAFAGMHEAYIASGDERCKHLADRIAEFFIRIQTQSPEHPEFSGLWMRAFDPEMWEYFGSSADKLWGAWCIESGWVNAPAAMIFTLRKINKGLFDLLPPDGAWKHWVPELAKEMQIVHPLPERTQQDYTVIGAEK